MTTTEPTTAPAVLPEILVQRLPGGSCWDLYRPDRGHGPRRTASPNLDLIAREAIREVRRLGGRAVVRFDDQDSITARAERARLGQETVNAVFAGARYWVRWSNEHQAFEPCPREGAGSRLIMRVDDIDHLEDGKYVHRANRHADSTAVTRPLDPHEIVHLVTVDGEVPA